MISQLADQFKLSPEERNALSAGSGQPTFYNRVHWAKSYLSKAALVEGTRRGHFKITERGTNLLDSHPAAINMKLLMQFPEFRKFRERTHESLDALMPDLAPVVEVEKQTPDEAMRAAGSQIEAALAQDLLDRILVAPPVL